MKSSPDIKFISLVILFVTILKVANDSYIPLSWISSKLLPYDSTSCLTLSRSPSLAAINSGCILGWPIDCGTTNYLTSFVVVVTVGYEQRSLENPLGSLENMLSPRAHRSIKTQSLNQILNKYDSYGF